MSVGGICANTHTCSIKTLHLITLHSKYLKPDCIVWTAKLKQPWLLVRCLFPLSSCLAFKNPLFQKKIITTRVTSNSFLKKLVRRQHSFLRHWRITCNTHVYSSYYLCHKVYVSYICEKDTRSLLYPWSFADLKFYRAVPLVIFFFLGGGGAEVILLDF